MIANAHIDEFLGRRKRYHYSVAPRYTPGSPAQVDTMTALRVASEEEEAYKRAREGRYGPRKVELAQTRGLQGIVEVCVETKKGWDVLDMLTGERRLEPFRS